MSKTKKFLIFILNLIGFITTIKLTIIYFDVNFNPYSLRSFCSINDFIDCDSVAKTTFSQFFGIPLALWGMALYSFIIMLIATPKLKEYRYLKFLEVFKNPYSYIYSLTLLSFLLSMILASISLFTIQKVCILCFLTYFLDLFIALLSRSWGKGFFYDIKTSIKDFIDGIKIKKYAIALAIIAIIGSIFLTFTTKSYILTPQIKRIDSLNEFLNMKNNPYKVQGNEIGDEDATIIVDEYIDYNCPGCYISNLMFQRAVSELRGIKVHQYNFPLDTACNPYVKVSMHENSCMLSRYALASKKQMKFWEMSTLLFENTPEKEDDVIKLAKKERFDIEKLKADANSKEIKEELKSEIEKANKEGIVGTPTTVINMKKELGAIPYYELKEKLIKLGATERK